MKKPIIVIKATPKQFKKVRNLAQRIYDNMNLNINFPSPVPTMVVLLAAIAAIDSKLAKWGEKGNRGSHQDYVNLVTTAKMLHTLLTEEAAYCMSIVNPNASAEDQTTFLLTSGFTLKDDATPQGVLQMVENFRRLFQLNVSQDQAKLKWSKPLNVTTRSNVKNYNVYRNITNNFATATIIASVTKTSYIDAPGIGTFYYWVVPTNTNGDGITSNVVIATFPQPA